MRKWNEKLFAVWIFKVFQRNKSALIWSWWRFLGKFCAHMLERPWHWKHVTQYEKNVLCRRLKFVDNFFSVILFLRLSRHVSRILSEEDYSSSYLATTWKIRTLCKWSHRISNRAESQTSMWRGCLWYWHRSHCRQDSVELCSSVSKSTTEIRDEHNFILVSFSVSSLFN